MDKGVSNELVKNPELLDETYRFEIKIFSPRLVSLRPSDFETVDTVVNILLPKGIIFFW